ncbi:MAG: NifB/NifX family molybdenum-iron cluster-binding protein [Thermodesulfobacteriota bacterium]|nr:NifB/NifX family molybdenum-iron cluster-binding protein [Thermodesulfobacteriota bacterium]
MELIIAFSTDNGEIFNDSHFGMASHFHVYKFSGGREEFVEIRKNVKYEEDESLKHGDPGKARATASVLDGIDVLAGRKFGPNIIRLLNRFVCVVVKTEKIADAVKLIHENMGRIVEEKNRGEERKHIVIKQ